MFWFTYILVVLTVKNYNFRISSLLELNTEAFLSCEEDKQLLAVVTSVEEFNQQQVNPYLNRDRCYNPYPKDKDEFLQKATANTNPP